MTDTTRTPEARPPGDEDRADGDGAGRGSQLTEPREAGVAGSDDEQAAAVAGAEGAGPVDSSGLWGDAWRSLRRNPLFLVGAFLLLVFGLMAVVPQLFTSIDANDRSLCDTAETRALPSADAWFGRDVFGCDYYSQVVYGARVSIAVGFLSAVGIVVLGITLGALAGWTGGWVDSVVSRFTDVWYGLPLILGAIILLSAFEERSVLTIALVLSILGWMTPMRLVRSGVLTVKEADYVSAAQSLGAGPWRIITKHVLPNSIAPLIVYATISIGVIISAEATLSFLGVGLPPDSVSWGVQLSAAQTYYRSVPTLVLFPGIFLVLTVLAFLLIGDALRDALDPKLK